MNDGVHGVRGPAGGETLGEVLLAGPAEIARATELAAAGQGAWAERPVSERAEVLEVAADLLTPDTEPLAELLCAESGKPIGQARSEVARAIALMRANAAEGRAIGGRVLPTEGHPGTERDLAFTRREPLGVVAAVVPFNFPVELYVEKVAAALVAGNAVVAKPPLEDPLVVGRVHDALIQAGAPPQVLALVHGGRDVGAALVADPQVDAVSLTGSTAAGISAAEASAPLLRPLHLELGGNNACLVLDDADLELVTSELAVGRLMMNGQACSASKRILVDPSLHDDLVERLVGIAETQVVGPAADPLTTIGPLITAEAAQRVHSQIGAAVAQGATVAAGGAAPEGALLAPTVLAEVPRDAAVAADDEISGPVFTVIPVGGDAAALAVANASSFGLMASVFSADIERAMALAERLRAGGVVINGTDDYRPPVVPVGGLKLSGTGRRGVGYTLRELTREKTIVLRRFRRGPDALGR
jgi:acyl-CoA reductase-like NAD-dependent aldehyde dehydrogenase